MNSLVLAIGALSCTWSPIGLAVFILEIWMVIESVIVLKKVYGLEMNRLRKCVDRLNPQLCARISKIRRPGRFFLSCRPAAPSTDFSFIP